MTARSAKSGRFVTALTARRNPRTTITMSNGSKSSGYRSSITGRYVTKATAARHPETTIHEGGGAA
ncbi:hypothetical protein [Mobilicoccus pelagius]|uniref:Uncharacterized protein n=1 Tax=Mobilicoccus pelagius NBRC 104925 TaxID=1089455 RepID=H5UST5_9MICO|nr:hypothetical protein [Mobilicoccus pelagius]GAB48793.1 hypothetical protein MOPEL_082_00020 [Mobilicoccus pelagius NBRC 104925]